MFEKITETIKDFFNKDSPEIIEQPSDDELIAFVKKEFERRQKDRIPFELQWQLNTNYLQGNQYCDINLDRQVIEEVTKQWWYQEREVFNHIAPIFETRLAKLGRVNPSLIVRPASNSREDISTAKVCTSIVKGTSRKLKMSKKMKTATTWMELTGTAFYKNIWNSSAGRVLGILDGEEIKEGDLSTDIIIPPYEIYPDSNFAADIEHCRSLIHAKAYYVDEIAEIWNKRVDGKEVDVFTLTHTKVSTGGLGYNANISKITTTKRKDSEIVMEYYEMPSQKYPEGRLIIVAGNVLLYNGEMPYRVCDDNKKGLPFVRQVCIENPGCFWGVSIIERCIPVQRSYNALKNRKREYLNRCVIGVGSYDEGSLVDPDYLQENGIAPGDWIAVNPGFNHPKFMENGALPSNFDTEEQNLLREFEHISGVSDLALKSGVPTGAGSGISLQILQEQDDTRISLTAENIRNAQVDNGQQWLRIYKQFAMTPRMIRFTEKDQVMVLDWEASDITSDDIELATENELTQSVAHRKQMVFDCMSAGLFNDPQTGRMDTRKQAKIIEMLQLGNWESSTDVSELHISRANRENMMVEKGQIPQVKSYDDDLIHIAEHNKYRLSTDYEELIAENPQIDMIFEQHIAQHAMQLNSKIQPQIQEPVSQV